MTGRTWPTPRLRAPVVHPRAARAVRRPRPHPGLAGRPGRAGPGAGRVGLLPAGVAETIAEHADVDRCRPGQGRRRNPGHRALHARPDPGPAPLLPEHAREWVYYGATVQDVTDTWIALVMRAVLDIVDRDLARCAAAAASWPAAPRHRDVRAYPRPARAADHLRLQGGGLGRGAGAAPGADRAGPAAAGGRPARWGAGHHGVLGRRRRWRCSTRSPHNWPGRAGHRLDHRPGPDRGVRHAARDGHRHTGQDRQRDLRAAAPGDRRAGRTVHPGQVGSITMPHKRNPELSEHLDTLARGAS